MDIREHATPEPIDIITVTKSADGWEVRETHDSEVVRTHHYSDWHRVERAVQVFGLRAAGAWPRSI
jgi:hypothetical protein